MVLVLVVMVKVSLSSTSWTLITLKSALCQISMFRTSAIFGLGGGRLLGIEWMVIVGLGFLLLKKDGMGLDGMSIPVETRASSTQFDDRVCFIRAWKFCVKRYDVRDVSQFGFKGL